MGASRSSGAGQRIWQPLRSMAVALTAMLSALAVTTAARADKTWPRFPSDGEIAVATELLHAECGGDRLFMPKESRLKSRVTKRRDSAYKDTRFAKTTREALDHSSVYMAAWVYWPRRDTISQYDRERGAIYEAVSCSAHLVFDGRFRPDRGGPEGRGYIRQAVSLKDMDDALRETEMSPQFVEPVGNTFQYFVAGFLSGPPEQPVQVKACPSFSGPGGETALLPAVDQAQMRIELRGAPNTILNIVFRRDGGEFAPAGLRLQQEQVTLDAQGYGHVDIVQWAQAQGQLKEAKLGSVDIFGVESGQKLASVPVAVGLGLQARVELRHLSTDASANPDVALVAFVTSRFHPTLDVADYFDAWEKNCPMDKVTVVPVFGTRDSIGRHGWLLPEEVPLPEAQGFGPMLLGKDAQGQSFLRALPGAGRYASPTGTSLPAIDLQVDATHVLFPWGGLAVILRSHLDQPPRGYADVGEMARSGEPDLFAPMTYLIVPIEQIPGWSDAMICMLEPQARWQSFLLALAEVYPMTSPYVSTVKVLMQASCEISRGETKNAFLTLLQAGSGSLAEYIAFKGVVLERLQKWNKKLNLPQQLSPNELNAQADEIEAAYKAALASYELVKPR